jgi:hypothetical protein
MPALRPPLSLIAITALLATGCSGDGRSEQVVTPEEQLLLGQLTRDRFVEIIGQERNDLDHLVVTTRQGSQRVRYVFKPTNPGDMVLAIHRIDDRSVLQVSESDQLGTGPQPGPSGRYR